MRGSAMDYVADYIDRHLILRSKDQSIPGKNGKMFSYLFRIKLGLSDPAFRACVFEDMARMIREDTHDLKGFQLAGVETTGAMLAAGISDEFRTSHHMQLPVVFIRKGRREYGEQKIIDGGLPNRRTIVIDDLINSGSTLRHAVSSLVSSGLTDVHHVTYSVINLNRSGDFFPFQVRSLYHKEDFRLKE